MINIIGLGDMGCRLADEFAKHDNYDVYKINVGLEKSKSSRGIKKEDHPEKYEKNCPSMKHFFKELEGRSILLVNGGELFLRQLLGYWNIAKPLGLYGGIHPARSNLSQ